MKTLTQRMRAAVAGVLSAALFGALPVGAGAQEPSYEPATLIAIGGDGQVVLRWEPVPGVERYEVRRRLGISQSAKEKGYTTIARDVAGTFFIDDKARNGSVYYYTLLARASDGRELESNPAKATPVSRPSSGSVKWPLSGSDAPDADGVAFQYGPRRIGRSYDFHAGIDIPARIGTPVYPVMDGVITAIEPWDGRRGPGNRVLINHGEQKWTGYLHLDEFAPGLQVGQQVQAGKTQLGTVGKTGAFSEHLHLTYMVGLQSEKTSEMRSMNPLEILPHTPPSDIAIEFRPDNIVEISLPNQHMTARWVIASGEGHTRLVDYYQVVEQGSKNRDEQSQFGLHLETTGLRTPFDVRTHFRLLLRPDPAEAFRIEHVRLIDFDGKTITEARAAR